MNLLFLTALAMAAGEAPSSNSAPPYQAQMKDVEMAQVIIQRRTIIRVPPVYALAPRQPVPLSWKEKGAPKCVTMSTLAGLAITRPDSIDLVLRGGQRIRAKLEKSCPSVDFYSGFYVKPHKDGRICQDRDQIHSRTGGACEIDKFKTLVAEYAKKK
jgi:hypothetical protein